MPAATSERICAEPACGERTLARGLCQLHYGRDYARRRKLAADPAARQPGVPPVGYVHAAPVRAHLADLKSGGISTVTAAALAGVTRHRLVSVASGVDRFIQRGHALAIMRIHTHPEDAEDRAMISAHGSKRRVQALVALGWRLGEIAEWLDCHQSELSNLIHPANRTVSGRRHRQIAAMFRERCMTVPDTPSPWSLSRASRERWVPPLAWDDIDRDERPAVCSATSPKETIDHIAVELALSGQKVKLRRADRMEAVRIGHGRRWSDRKIARVTGIIEKSVFRIRCDLGLPGLQISELR